MEFRRVLVRSNLAPELLASERMGMIIEEIAKRYPDRIVIFDSPPALASSIASVLALHVGQIMFIVEAERTREPQLKEALSLVSGTEAGRGGKECVLRCKTRGWPCY